MTGSSAAAGSEPPAPVTIFTVGHGTRPVEEFIDLLRSAGVRRLVDVRTAPGSRRHPQYGRTELDAAMRDAGIAYQWVKGLGGWRSPHPGSPHVALRSSSFRGYADHMDTEEFDRTLMDLVTTSRDVPTAIMCAETLWWRCHRRMIADALLLRGCRVLHLVAPGRLEPHPLHPAARVEGGRLLYDGGVGRPSGPRTASDRASGQPRRRDAETDPPRP